MKTENLKIRGAFALLTLVAALTARAGSPFWLGWEPTSVAIGNDHDGFADSVPARRMLSDTNAVAVAALPYFGRTPEEPDRILLACSDLSVRSAYAGILQASEDGGETWSPLQTSGAHLGRRQPDLREAVCTQVREAGDAGESVFRCRTAEYRRVCGARLPAVRRNRVRIFVCNQVNIRKEKTK